MKSTLKMEDRILSGIAFGCCVFALTACGVATCALVMLSQAANGGLGQGLRLTASQF